MWPLNLLYTYTHTIYFIITVKSYAICTRKKCVLIVRSAFTLLHLCHTIWQQTIEYLVIHCRHGVFLNQSYIRRIRQMKSIQLRLWERVAPFTPWQNIENNDNSFGLAAVTCDIHYRDYDYYIVNEYVLNQNETALEIESKDCALENII